MKNKKVLIFLGILLVVLIAAAAIFMAVTSANANSGIKHITVEVVYKDGTSESFDLTTEEEFLAGAMIEAGLLPAYSADGYYTIVNGVEAVWDVDQGWWCITKDGQSINYGFNDIAITDGDHYETTYTIGM